jgi:hypothetical protein
MSKTPSSSTRVRRHLHRPCPALPPGCNAGAVPRVNARGSASRAAQRGRLHRGRALRAGAAGRNGAADEATEPRVEDDAVAFVHSRHAGLDAFDRARRFVAEDVRRGDQRCEGIVPRAIEEDLRHVAAADAGEPSADDGPARAGRRFRHAFQAQRRDGRNVRCGREGARGPGEGEPWRGVTKDEGAHRPQGPGGAPPPNAGASAAGRTSMRS